MPRSALSNLKRRGAVYWWRRKIFLKALGFSEKFSISSEFSLLTKELDHARGRSAAMTAYSERLRMFILPPSIAELHRRLKGRGTDSAEVIAARMERARAEISHWDGYDHVIINDYVDQCFEKVRAILQGGTHEARAPDRAHSLRARIDALSPVARPRAGT